MTGTCNRCGAFNVSVTEYLEGTHICERCDWELENPDDEGPYAGENQ